MPNYPYIRQLCVQNHRIMSQGVTVSELTSLPRSAVRSKKQNHVAEGNCSLHREISLCGSVVPSRKQGSVAKSIQLPLILCSASFYCRTSRTERRMALVTGSARDTLSAKHLKRQVAEGICSLHRKSSLSGSVVLSRTQSNVAKSINFSFVIRQSFIAEHFAPNETRNGLKISIRVQVCKGQPFYELLETTTEICLRFYGMPCLAKCVAMLRLGY